MPQLSLSADQCFPANDDLCYCGKHMMMHDKSETYLLEVMPICIIYSLPHQVAVAGL